MEEMHGELRGKVKGVSGTRGSLWIWFKQRLEGNKEAEKSGQVAEEGSEEGTQRV